MKTPMNVFNTAMKKKKKNRKGFSLVELIVVLVIMAILAAALVPTLIGYIKQTRQSNSKNEASSAVSAAQTIASSAYADPNGKYDGTEIYTVTDGKLNYDATFTNNADAKTTDVCDICGDLSEVTSAGGTVNYIKITNGVVKGLNYTAKNGTKIQYNGSEYNVVSGDFPPFT